MTCIAGLVHEGVVYIGGDSATSTTTGSSVVIKANHKVFCVGPFVIGVAGQPRVGQLLRFAFMPPPQSPGDPNPYRYMVTTFVDAVRQTLKAGGLAQRDKEQESMGASRLLVGYRGCLFTMSANYGITVARDHFDAIGSGGEAARGALHASAGKDPVARMHLALEAAEQFTTGVRCPFTILRQKTRLIPPSVEEIECCEIDLAYEGAEEPDADAATLSSPAA